MPFMVPVYTQEAFVTVTDKHGDSVSVPAEYRLDVWEDGSEIEVHPKDKWWAHLSAPGYMDQTEWSGPYDTLKAAKAYIENTYEVDPETGEELV